MYHIQSCVGYVRVLEGVTLFRRSSEKESAPQLRRTVTEKPESSP
jgi:hypothetical protein